MKKSNKKVQKKTVQSKKAKPVIKAKVKVKAKVKTKKSVVNPKAKPKPKPKAKPKPKLKVKHKAKPKPKPKAKVKPKTKKAVAKVKVKKAAPVKVKKTISKSKTVVSRPAKKTIPKKRSLSHSTFGPVDVRPYFSKKNEDYMNQKQLGHFQEILLQWKELLMVDVDRTMHNMQDGSSNYPDPVDRASQEEEFNLELRTRDRDRKLLKKIDDALMRIIDHDYGYCDDCGAEIGIRRLEARPTATQCIECKTIAEIREKQLGDV